MQVSEDLLDHHRVLDAGDDAHRPAAHRAGLDVDAEHALEALRPSHPRPALGRGALVCLDKWGQTRFAVTREIGVCPEWHLLKRKRQF